MSTANLTSVQKIAVVLSTIPDEQCVEILKHYSEEDVEAICRAMIAPPEVDPGTREKILAEFNSALTQESEHPALENIENLLARLYGVRRSSEIVQRLQGRTNSPTDFATLAESIGPSEVAESLARETPVVAAFALAELPAALAAKILAALPDHRRTDVLLARAKGARALPEAAVNVREGLVAALERRKGGGGPDVNEVLASADILSQLAAETSTAILESLRQKDAEIGRRVAEALFTFDDLVRLEDKDLQRLLGRINQADMKLALRKCPDAVSQKVFKNMSERVATGLKEEIKTSPPQKAAAVQEAQRRVAAFVRELVQKGEITVARAASEKAEPTAPEEQLV